MSNSSYIVSGAMGARKVEEFLLTSAPICNMVKGWQKETEFYINSYNKLTILSPTGQAIQLKDPIAINDFILFQSVLGWNVYKSL